MQNHPYLTRSEPDSKVIATRLNEEILIEIQGDGIDPGQIRELKKELFEVANKYLKAHTINLTYTER